MKRGPYILDADNIPKLVTGREYLAWVRSLQASEEWRFGGKAFETLFLRSDWLPGNAGAINTVFNPYAPEEGSFPMVFETTISIGHIVNWRFANPGANHVFCGRYHTREQAIAGHNRILNAIHSAGLAAVLSSMAPPPEVTP